MLALTTVRACTSCTHPYINTAKAGLLKCYRCLSSSPVSLSEPIPSHPSSQYFSDLHHSSTLFFGSPPTYPARGGQNLTERYKRLEGSLKRKSSLAHERDTSLNMKIDAEVSAGGGMDSGRYPPSSSSVASTSVGTGTGGKDKKDASFHGFKIPTEPRPPESDECCMSGCAVCVYDLHEESLSSYKESIKSLRSSLTALGIAEDTWPDEIRRRRPRRRRNADPLNSASAAVSGVTPGTEVVLSEAEQAKKQRNVSMNAFEEMEMKLREKKEKGEKEREAKVDLSTVGSVGRLSAREISNS